MNLLKCWPKEFTPQIQRETSVLRLEYNFCSNFSYSGAILTVQIITWAHIILKFLLEWIFFLVENFLKISFLGRDASALFPSIVKLVASSKPELKKLVYVYLERYAQEQQELALLSISTFQRGLKDHNQVGYCDLNTQK